MVSFMMEYPDPRPGLLIADSRKTSGINNKK